MGIVGLSEDGTSASVALLDCEDATWRIERVTHPRAAHGVTSSDLRERQAVAEAIANADLPY